MAAAVASCADAGQANTDPVVDTLASGAIHVSNPLPPDDVAFELVEELRIGRVQGEGPDIFSEIQDLAVDAEGRIYVLDQATKELRVFDDGGGHLWTVGGDGEGPGEISFPLGLTFDDRGRVWVADVGNSRYSVFEDGRLVEEHRRHVTAGIVPWVGGFDRGGRFWESYGSYSPETGDVVGVVGLDSELVPRDSLLAGQVEAEVFQARVGSRWTRTHVPFTPWIAWRFDPRGYLFVGDAAAYTMHQLALSGDTVRIIERDYQPVPVQPAELDSALAGLDGFRRRGGTVDPSRLPGVKPAFQALFVGSDGRVWTLLHTSGDALKPGPPETLLDVFAPDGTHQGVARARSRLEPFTPTPVITGTHMYAAALDDFGVQFVVRLRVDSARRDP